MDLANFSIQEFLGILFVGFPVLIFVMFVILEFVARMREHFTTEKRTFFHHHFHYRDRR